jgi:hypothetical protein
MRRNAATANVSSGKAQFGKPGLTLARNAQPKLPDQLREALRTRHYSRRTEQTYCSWGEHYPILKMWDKFFSNRSA